MAPTRAGSAVPRVLFITWPTRAAFACALPPRIFATMSEASARDQTMRVLDGYRHELHNEPGEMKATVLAMVDEWMQARLV